MNLAAFRGAKRAAGAGLLALFMFGSGVTGAAAASLRVSPVLIDVVAPGAAAALRLRNGGQRPTHAQIRVFRWEQVGGQERLVPTNDVVASPPIVQLQPGKEYVVRVVRLSKRPVRSEESYRLLVDELPQPKGSIGGAVNLAVRQSIPVFFGPNDRSAPPLDWSVERAGDQVSVVVRNGGNRRARISELALAAGGRRASFGDGLVGYALAGSTMRWTLPGRSNIASGSGKVGISAQTDLGPITSAASVRPR